ncbi:MAG: serine/threonine-protein kinase, partial [Deltaproteobacteria bacterium]
GIVYRAVDARLEKEVAVKVLKEDFAHRTDVVARFTLEAKSAARIKHENVLDVTDYGQTEAGSFYIAMELLTGCDLADSLAKTGTIEPSRCVAIMIQVSRALGAAHGKGIVHRDLKPENIFLVPGEDQREVVKIVDFGIAQMKDMSGNDSPAAQTARKLTRTGMIFGTPEYMSPEQAQGKSIDHRVDVYAVGVIMYEMLAGRVPFVGDTFMGVLTQHMFEPIPPIKSFKPDANVPRDLEVIIDKALMKDPAQRYQSMQELCDDLVRFREGQRPLAASAASAPALPADATARHGTPTVEAIPSGVGPVSRTVETAPNGGTKRGVALAAGAVMMLLVGGGVAVALSRSGGTSGGTVTRPAGNGNGTTGNTVNGGRATTVVADAGHAVASGSTADAAVIAAPAQIRIHVATTPVNARIEAEGVPVSCDQSPCDLTVRSGHSIHLVATAPHKRGEITLTPERDGQDVAIALLPIAPPASGNHPGNTRPNGNAHVRSSGTCPPNGMHIDSSTGLMVPCFGGSH